MPLSGLKARAAAFSPVISVLDSPLQKFGDITVSRACDGVGMSGLTTSQLGFTVPGELTAPRAAKVTLTGVGNLPTYYVASRSTSKGVTSVTCYDRMAFADTNFPYSDFSVNTVPIAEILQKIADVCGVGACVGVPSWITGLSKAKLQGTCSDIMSAIATAACGFWRVSTDNKYEFVPFGPYTATMAVKQHTALDVGCGYSVQGVQGTDSGGNVYTAGSSSLHSYDGIIVDSDFITNDGVSEIWGRAKNAEMVAVNCEKAIVNDIPEINTLVTFGQGGSYIINNISCSVSAGGIVAALTGNAPSGDEIGTRGCISKGLSQAVKLGKQTGSQIVTAYQGTMYKSEGKYSG